MPDNLAFRQPFSTGELAILGQIVVSSITYIFYFVLLRIGGPVYFSQVGYIIVLTGIFWGMVLFDENPASSFWAGLIGIFVGLSLVKRAPRQAVSV